MGQHADAKAGAKAAKTKPPSTATRLVRLAEGCVLFSDPEGTGYATVESGDHRETWPLRRKGFKTWLARRYYEHYKTAPNDGAQQDALTTLEGRAIFEGDTIDVHIRVAEHDGKIYIDLANQDWEAVEVSAEGWHVIESREVPIRFIRKRGMLPLPQPVEGGSTEQLREHINCRSDDDWTLIVAWLVASMRPTGPYPVLALHGEQGSCKSTLSRFLRELVDPNQSPLRRPPRGERDLMIAASNGWIVGFDNLSYVKADLSDGLCALATGAGFATRELYSDDDERLFAASRPIILNGIAEVATRPDLLDRSLTIQLPQLADADRQSEGELRAGFDEAKPGILGGLLDAISTALANVDSMNSPVWRTSRLGLSRLNQRCRGKAARSWRLITGTAKARFNQPSNPAPSGSRCST